MSADQTRKANDIPSEVWRWVREQTPHDEFGYWVYGNEDVIKRALPDSLADELLAVDFWAVPVTRSDVEQLRRRLQQELPRACACPLMCDRQTLPLGVDFTSKQFDEVFETLASRTPWLTLARCRRCRQHWYVGCDTSDDYWFFERLGDDTVGRILRANEWPPTFDGWENVWPGGTPRRGEGLDPKSFRGGIVTDFTGGV